MKKIFTLFTGLLLLSATAKLSAQSFTIQHDTATLNSPTGLVTVVDGVTPGASNVTITWKVIETNFPSDWQAGTGICDNNQCYSSGLLWPSGTTKTSFSYAAGVLGDFHMQIDLDGATTLGCYYYKVRLSNQVVPTDTAIETYIVCKNSITAVPTVKSTDDILLYPNPATNELNIVYDASADIKSIAVYNIIGKTMTVYKVTANNSANLNLENLPSGIYFARLINSQGNVVVTRKFTKQ